MRTTVIISKRGAGYISDVSGKFGGGHKGARAGLTEYDAAATAARLMIAYAQTNPDGGDLMAPPEVMDQVPEHLRKIDADTSLTYMAEMIADDDGLRLAITIYRGDDQVASHDIALSSDEWDDLDAGRISSDRWRVPGYELEEHERDRQYRHGTATAAL